MARLLSHRLLERGGGSSGDDNAVIWSCCCIMTIITTAVILIVSLIGSIPNTPNCAMDLFDTHGINKTANSTTTTTQTSINYDLVLDVDGNGHPDKSIYYDDINLEFFHKPNRSSIGIATVTYPAFHQKYGQSHLAGFIDGSGLNWENVRAAVAQNGSAVFRVDLHTSFRCSNMFWFKTKRRHLAVGADLHVNDQGKLIKGKKNHGVKLTSGAHNISLRGYLHILPFLASLAFLHFGFIVAKINHSRFGIV